jgi:hypothetical protein
MSSRSPSTMVNNMNLSSALAENSELIERNRNLELKLRYVQSVNTIFRQRVGVLLQALTTKLAEVQVVAAASDMKHHYEINLDNLLNSVNDSARLVEYQHHLDARNNNSSVARTTNNNNNATASSSSFSHSEVAYWQDRFIEAMSNIQPISQAEVETLCRLIREKVDRDSLIQQQQKQIRELQHQQQLLSSSSKKEDSSSSVGRTSRSALAANYGEEVADEIIALREQLKTSEARCKSLNFRLAELRKHQIDSESQKSISNLDLTHEVGVLASTVKELRARLAEQEALNRRLVTEVNGLRSDKNLQLQHLARMQGMCAAVMRESQCAVNEGLAATQMNESALLKRQLDTFELVLRKTEQELTKCKKIVEEKENQLMEKEREVQSLQLRMDSKEKTLELYKARCEKMATSEKEQRDEHLKAMQLLKSRVGDAVQELEGAYTTKGITAGLEKVATTTEKISILSTSLVDLQKKYNSLRACFAALSEEVTLAAKQNRVPRQELIIAEEARVLVLGEEKKGGDENENVAQVVKVPREKILRTDGNWKEIRDLNEGSVFYVTTAITDTPFNPAGSILLSKPTSSAASSPPPSPPKQSVTPTNTTAPAPVVPTTNNTTKEDSPAVSPQNQDDNNNSRAASEQKAESEKGGGVTDEPLQHENTTAGEDDSAADDKGNGNEETEE